MTDGFTGNVALKTMEGTLRFLIGALTEIFSRPDVAEAADRPLPHLLPLAAAFDPDNTGGAMLLGVDGVCVISHGSSSARWPWSTPSRWPTTWPWPGWSRRWRRR